jgi:class 3 adenylate cyclase
LHPATLSGLLQEYLFYLNQAAKLYGGEFHRMNGESVVVSFDEDTCADMHSINALYCAGLFLSIMARVNNRHRKKGEQVLEFRLAIHSGDIFLAPGLCGQDQADKYSILGKTLDITYFLSKQGAPNELVISEATCYQARSFENFATDRQREVSMPADNVSFMAYILTSGFAEDLGMIRKQRRHILGAPTGEQTG